MNFSDVLSTSPFDPPTHWKQTAFPLKESLDMAQDEYIYGVIEVKKHPESHRALSISIKYKKDPESSFIESKFVMI